jgi:ABC-type multidrug transport system fused ATPase/permease subunit
MLTTIYSKLFKLPKSTIDFIVGSKELVRRRLWLTIPITVWSTAIFQLYPLLIKFQVDTLTDSWTNILGVSFGSVLRVFMVFVALSLSLDVLSNILTYFKDKFLYTLKQESQKQLEDSFTDHLKTFDGGFLSGENNLRIVRSLQQGIDGLQEKLVDFLSKGIEAITGIVAVIVIIPFIHPYLLVIVLATALIDLGLDVLQNWKWRQYELIEQRQRDQRDELRWRYIWYFNAFLQNNWFAQIYNTYKIRRDKSFATSKKQQLTDLLFSFIKGNSRKILEGLATLIAGYLVIRGDIPLGTFVVFSFYISRIQSQFKIIAEVFRIYFETRFDLYRLDFLLHLKPKFNLAVTDTYQGGGVDSIKAEHVSFAYPSFFDEERNYITIMKTRLGLIDAEKPKSRVARFPWLVKKMAAKSMSTSKQDFIRKELDELDGLMSKQTENKLILKDMSFEFQRGKIYGVIGHNGAGKTTLMKLLKRGLDTTTGAISIDNKPLQEIEQLSWKAAFASLEQSSFLVQSLSILENMQLGIDHQLDEAQVRRVFETLGISKAIPDIHALIGEGVEFSGGQRQLIEVARVLLQKKPIVILDEGTNQMDAEKENQVLEILQQNKKEAIILFVSHRMTAMKKCDEILIMEHGMITGTGKPQQLLNSKKPNLFKKFWELQVNG